MNWWLRFGLARWRSTTGESDRQKEKNPSWSLAPRVLYLAILASYGYGNFATRYTLEAHFSHHFQPVLVLPFVIHGIWSTIEKWRLLCFMHFSLPCRCSEMFWIDVAFLVTSSFQHDGLSSHLTSDKSFHPDNQDNPASRLTWKGLRGSISFCRPPKFIYNDPSRSSYSSPTVYQVSNTCSHGIQTVYEATKTRIRSSTIANVTMHLPSCIRALQKRDWVSSSR